MSVIKAVISGIIGAVVLTVIHQVARRRVAEEPRMDILGLSGDCRLAGTLFAIIMPHP